MGDERVANIIDLVVAEVKTLEDEVREYQERKEKGLLGT